MAGISSRPYGAFEVVGLELEYAVIDSSLRPLCLVEDLFRFINGRPTSDVEYGDVGFSNELAAHVFEIKTLDPRPSLLQIESALLDGVRYATELLRDNFGARLLPAGMHPFMSPHDTKLWRRAGRSIYETYAAIFPIYEHGWMNVQSSHVNLPFGSEPESVAQHNAVACLLPYLPALAASSPVYDGNIGAAVDNRLMFYNTNQRRVPEISGTIVPEFIGSHSDYRKKVFGPIKRALSSIPGSERLQLEWTNSRGAIMRFSRNALEIKVLDIQECVKADVAIAAFIRSAARDLVEKLKAGELELPPHSMLVSDYHEVVRRGTAATVMARHLRDSTRMPAATTARDVLLQLLETAWRCIPDEEQSYLNLIEERIHRGNLSERIARAIERRSSSSGSNRQSVITDIYWELCDCLEANRTW